MESNMEFIIEVKWGYYMFLIFFFERILREMRLLFCNSIFKFMFIEVLVIVVNV